MIRKRGNYATLINFTWLITSVCLSEANTLPRKTAHIVLVTLISGILGVTCFWRPSGVLDSIIISPLNIKQVVCLSFPYTTRLNPISYLNYWASLHPTLKSSLHNKFDVGLTAVLYVFIIADELNVTGVMHEADHAYSIWSI